MLILPCFTPKPSQLEKKAEPQNHDHPTQSDIQKLLSYFGFFLFDSPCFIGLKICPGQQPGSTRLGAPNSREWHGQSWVCMRQCNCRNCHHQRLKNLTEFITHISNSILHDHNTMWKRQGLQLKIPKNTQRCSQIIMVYHGHYDQKKIFTKKYDFIVSQILS